MQKSSAKNVSARAVAIHALERIERDGAHISRVLNALPTEADQVRRQSTEYVAGVTRRRRWLDYLLAQRYQGDYGAMELRLKQLLRVGAYELLYMQTPEHATVHEAVELAKDLVRPKAGKLVNAMLRNLVRSTKPLEGPKTRRKARDLAVRYSHPTWMVRRWLARFGEQETVALLKVNNERPRYSLRIHLNKISVEQFHKKLHKLGISWEPSPWLDDFVRVDHIQPIRAARLFEKGWCAVQDEGAGMVVRLLDPQPGETILDVCAAPGGKALYAAHRMRGSGRVVASDVHASRIGLVQEAAAQQALANVATQTADLLTEVASLPLADRVLLDAPCSGLGVLAKRADLRWQRNEAYLTELAHLQDQLLDQAASRVCSGGLLVYSTCTIEPLENKERIDAFLKRNGDFVLEAPAAGTLPAEFIHDDCYASWPHRHGIDGAFGARLRKR